MSFKEWEKYIFKSKKSCSECEELTQLTLQQLGFSFFSFYYYTLILTHLKKSISFYFIVYTNVLKVLYSERHLLLLDKCSQDQIANLDNMSLPVCTYSQWDSEDAGCRFLD